MKTIPNQSLSPLEQRKKMDREINSRVEKLLVNRRLLEIELQITGLSKERDELINGNKVVTIPNLT